MNQKKEDGAEMLPLVDENGIVTGYASREVCHDGCKLLHPVVHLHVFNPEGDLYLQKRPLWKIVQPGKWDTAVGGHVSFGEHVEKALHREALEELGIKDFQPECCKPTFMRQTWRGSMYMLIAAHMKLLLCLQAKLMVVHIGQLQT